MDVRSFLPNIKPMEVFSQKFLSRLALSAGVLLTLKAYAANPLWNGAGSATNNLFSNTNNWVAGSVPVGNSINGSSVNFGPLAAGATNTANCDATGNSGVWTFNSGTPPMVITLNETNQLGAPAGPDVFVNNSTNLQTIIGAFRLFDINGTTTSRRFNAAVGPLLIAPGVLTLRGDSSPMNWAIELGGSAAGSQLNCGFANGGNLGGKTVNLLKTGAGTWEILSPLPDLTTNATAVTVAAGTLTLDAANSYTGPTIVSNGAMLNTVTVSMGGGTYAVSNAATLGVTVGAVGSSLTNAALTLGTTGSDASTLNFNLGGSGNPTQPAITVNGVLTVNGTATLNLTNGLLSVGQFPLIQYGSQTGAANLVLGSLPAYTTASLSNNLANHSIDLVVTAVTAAPVTWDGNLSAVWDINMTANWQIGGVAGQFYHEGDPVVFDDTAAGNFAVALTGSLHPQSVTVSNNVNSYTFSGLGGLSWTGGLLKAGTNGLTLGEANFFGGPVVVSAGALVLNNLNSVTGPGGLNIADGAVVQPKLAGTYASVPTTLNGSSTANYSSGGSLDFHVTGTEIWPGQINLNDPSATIGCYGSSCNVTLAGPLTGSGSLTIRPEGGSAASHTATFTLSNPGNNYAGSTTIKVGISELKSTLKLGVDNGLPVTTALFLDHVGSSGTVYFDLTGHSQTLSGLTSDFGSNAVINSSGTAGTLVVSNPAANTLSGDLGAAGAANFSFVKTGAGTLTLGGPNNYTGTTTITAGTLAVPGLVPATSGLILSSNATLRLAVGAPGSPTNIVVNGNVTLAGQLDLTDAGIVSNTPYPVIYYSGTLNTNGLTAAAPKLWAFTIDTSVPHLVRLIPTQSFPLIEFTNGDFAVTTLTTNLGGTLRDTTAGPIWYEVRDQTNKLWDFGATAAVSPWSITVRNLREGINTVTIFAQSSGGVTYSNSMQLTLTLGPNPAVRPRPIPSEIWWGGIPDNTQLTNYSQWPFVQKYQDGYLLHDAYWNGSLAWLLQSLARNLQPFNVKFMPELAGNIPSPSTNSGAAQLNNAGGKAAFYESNGIILSEFTHDYHMENLQPLCQVNPAWPTNDDIAWWTGDLSIASTNYPYTSGIWKDVFTGYYQLFPHVKVGLTSQPEWWPWGSYPAGVANQLAFTITNSSGQNIKMSLNASNVFASFMNMAAAIGQPYFSMQSDAPWDYFGGGGVGTPASEATMRQMIRAYENSFQTRSGRHTLICNVSNAGTNYSGAVYYESSSLSSMYLHQKEGGRANRYLFESWYWGVPSVVVPETLSGSYTHLAMSAIKYLKGIADTNGTLEPLNLTLLSNGATNVIQLQNNGDITCFPAVTATDSGGPGTVAYYNAAGSNITSTILSVEGYVHTNLLAPGQTTTISIVSSVQPLNRAITLEAFWNPQDPTGVVRSRLIVTQPNTPPSLATNADVTIVAGTTLIVTNTATDTNLPPQTLTFSLLAAPANAAINATNGIFSWRPAIAQSPSTNLITVVVTDNGTPALSATNSFYVTVNTPVAPAMANLSLSNGLFSMQVSGDSGPDYVLQTSTNLTPPVNWLPIQTNVSAVPPLSFSDAGATNFNRRFYRVRLGP